MNVPFKEMSDLSLKALELLRQGPILFPTNSHNPMKKA